MDKCDYTIVNSEKSEEVQETESTASRKSLLRQLFVCSGIWACYFTFGLCYGTPTVLIAQMRREANSSDAVTPEMASWISATYNYTGFMSAILLAILARLIGRKLSFLFVAVTSMIGFVLLYFSINVSQILISEVIHGPLTACQITISIMVLTEYVSPRYRGVFLTLKSASFLWGIWVANAIGTFYHWKNIAIFGLICTTYFLTTAFFWPESPYWLAHNGRFKECAESHHWLKGYTAESEEELKKVIQSRQKYMKTDRRKSHNFMRGFVKMVKSRAFYKPVLLCMLVLALYHFSGKVACGMYAIDIIKKITNNESTAYSSMLILDGITVLGMYVGCFVAKIVTRRALLLVCSTIGFTFAYALSLYSYLIKLGYFVENTYISITLLIGYSLAISVGPLIMSTTILGELTPVKYRNFSMLLLGSFANFQMGLLVKILPFILVSGGIHGLFLFFGMIASVCTILTYKLLPETKDKTLLEIQESLLGPSDIDNDEIIGAGDNTGAVDTDRKQNLVT